MTIRQWQKIMYQTKSNEWEVTRYRLRLISRSVRLSHSNNPFQLTNYWFLNWYKWWSVLWPVYLVRGHCLAQSSQLVVIVRTCRAGPSAAVLLCGKRRRRRALDLTPTHWTGPVVGLVLDGLETWFGFNNQSTLTKVSTAHSSVTPKSCS